MIRKELLDAVSGLNFWARDQRTGINRPDYANRIGKYFGTSGLAISIIGTRRAGKTFIARGFLNELMQKGLIKKEQTLYVNFEEPLLEPFLNTELLNDLYDTYRHFLNKDKLAVLVLDEIHTVPRWEKWIRIMLEKGENVKVIITGSSSKLSSKELATVLTGRTISVKVFPLSFGEFLRFSNFNLKSSEGVGQKKEITGFMHTYIEYGGFPLIALTKEPDVKLDILKDIFEGIITKDIAARHEVRRLEELKLLAVLALHNFSCQVSVKKLSDMMQNVAKRKISPSTVNSFLHYFSEAFLFFYVPIFSYKIKDQLLYPKKLYCVDTGMINAVSSRFSENIGRLAENATAVELVKRYGNDNLFYWKDDKSGEVDFVLKDGTKVRQLIQVCWDVNSNPETKTRETKSLLACMGEFGLKTGLVLTGDFEGEEIMDGCKITYTPLWKWLLS